MIGTASIALRGFPLMHDAPPRRGGSSPKTKSPSADATTSLELVLRANAGDDTALSALYERYRPRLHRWAHNRLPSGVRGALQTEDLVQDTLTHVLQHLDGFNPRHEGAFQGYVRTALLNRIRDLARRSKRRGPSGPLDTRIIAPDDSPLDIVIGRETLARYDAALERLRPEDSELIIARIEMGLPYAEIAVMFEKPSVAAVHMAVSRALIKLAQEMAHERKR
jgi:RNA polymerase sigma-70 factor, ECF subfamily